MYSFLSFPHYLITVTIYTGVVTVFLYDNPNQLLKLLIIKHLAVTLKKDILKWVEETS